MERDREASLPREIILKCKIHLGEKTLPQPSKCEQNLHQHHMRLLHHTRGKREKPAAPSIKNNAQPS